MEKWTARQICQTQQPLHVSTKRDNMPRKYLPQNLESTVICMNNCTILLKPSIFLFNLMVSTEVSWWNILKLKLYTTLGYIISLILLNLGTRVSVSHRQPYGWRQSSRGLVKQYSQELCISSIFLFIDHSIYSYCNTVFFNKYELHSLNLQWHTTP